MVDDDPVEAIGEELRRSGRTLAVAESLTGGMLAARFARASGSSDWFAGGTVAYSRSFKHRVLDVPPGPVVSAAAAAAMADGVARLTGADVTLAVTGVGGPDPQDGEPPGTVWVCARPGEPVLLNLEGEPGEVCEQACTAAVGILLESLSFRPARG